MRTRIYAATFPPPELTAWPDYCASEWDELVQRARQTRVERTGRTITYSRKVFIPLTNLCRDRCGYCTFARTPDDPLARTLEPHEVVAIAEAGRRAGCKEALFSLGERPELRYPDYRLWLRQRGYDSTIAYLADMCRLVFETTGLIPHANPGTLTLEEIELLRPYSISMGMMQESISERLLMPGEAHYACPDKRPGPRLETLRAAGRAGVPFTTGILIGIGETFQERVDTLLAIREIHQEFGHVQEVIIQNFRAKAGTLMANWAEPGITDLVRTATVGRLIFGPEVNLQIPPNLTSGRFGELLAAGINDWGGISPVTLDHINPERAWPELLRLKQETSAAGFELRERLSVYPEYLRQGSALLQGPMGERIRSWIDDTGLVRREEELW